MNNTPDIIMQVMDFLSYVNNGFWAIVYASIILPLLWCLIPERYLSFFNSKGSGSVDGEGGVSAGGSCGGGGDGGC